MSYIIRKASPEQSPRRIIISSPDTRSLQSRKYVIKNRDSSLNSFRYVDNDYDGYISDGPVIVQKPTPRTVIVQQEPQQKKYVYVEDEVEDDEDIDDNEEETLYYIDGKYYKSKPQQNPVQNVVYVNKPQPQKENVVYYVDEEDDDEYDDPIIDDAPVIQKKIIINKKPKPIQAPPPPPPKIVYVNESPKPTYYESPRVTYKPKPPSVVVKQTLRPLESQPPQQKPLQKIILENRSKPRNNYRREIEKIEIKDKPLPNRNIIHGNTIVYK